MRLIDADEIEYELAFREFYLKAKWEEQPMVWKTEIDQMPTVDAVPVIHGEWLETESSNLLECSCCHVWWGAYDTDYYRYCPNCGARMDEE